MEQQSKHLLKLQVLKCVNYIHSKTCNLIGFKIHSCQCKPHNIWFVYNTMFNNRCEFHRKPMRNLNRSRKLRQWKVEFYFVANLFIRWISVNCREICFSNQAAYGERHRRSRKNRTYHQNEVRKNGHRCNNLFIYLTYEVLLILGMFLSFYTIHSLRSPSLEPKKSPKTGLWKGYQCGSFEDVYDYVSVSSYQKVFQ